MMMQNPEPSKAPLRVAVVTETYPPEINGVAMTMGRLVEGLEMRGHRIQLIRPRQGAADVPVQRERLSEVLCPGMPIPRYGGLRMGLPNRSALLRAWTSSRPDIVHVVTEGPLGWSALAAAARLKIPVCTDFHTNFHVYSSHYGFGWLKRAVAAYLRHFHNKALCTLVPTRAVVRELEFAGFHNLAVVPRGVDARLFNPAKRSAALRARWGATGDHPVVLYVGRVAPEKNLPLAARAFEAMRRADPLARFVVVGDGPERAEMEARHPDYVFAGVRRGDDLAAHYASSDIFLFPSLSETYGNVTVEAMASGLAVVAYDYAAAAEHIASGGNGLTAPFDDSRRFVESAVGLVESPDTIARLREGARATAVRLDWEMVYTLFEEILIEIAAKERAS
ncbi:MAG: glycosyltransferase family 1 protein [Betaproteobacteria bacterium]|nr:glycosyltransferase family 1 protein [Betaproteobacteria bacterium]